MENVIEEYLIIRDDTLFTKKKTNKNAGYIIASMVKLQKEMWKDMYTK